jgi:cell division septation protein DedD
MRRSLRISPRLVTGMLALTAMLAGVPVAAQADLGEIETLAGLGRADEARVALLDWWEDGRDNASRTDIQRGLWLRGRLTVDPTQAARDFRRLVVEYPGGPFTDAALFRLSQGAHASGDIERARTYMSSLARDYPNSAIRREAEAWLVGAGDPPLPASPVDPGDDTAGSAAEESPAPITPPEPEVPRETTPPPPAEATSRTDPPATTGRYSVQLGAFSGAERAEALLQRAEDAGLAARIVNVRGSRLLHVRVGRFDSSGEASVFFRSVTDLGFTAAVVRDADREESGRE